MKKIRKKCILFTIILIILYLILYKIYINIVEKETFKNTNEQCKDDEKIKNIQNLHLSNQNDKKIQYENHEQKIKKKKIFNLKN